jgi:V/A-type H+-transporting ATPase subunit I
VSIAQLFKVTLIGPASIKSQVIADLQALGCLMLLPTCDRGEHNQAPPSRQVHDALAFLLSCPDRRKQTHDAASFDPQKIQVAALEVQRKLHDLEDERDALTQRLRDLLPWGEFEPIAPEHLGGRKVWFYAIAHQQWEQFESLALAWKLIRRDGKARYVAVIGESDPPAAPFEPAVASDQGPAALRKRLDDVLQQIEDCRQERHSLSRWCDQFVRHLNEMEDLAARNEAGQQTLEASGLFGIQAWAPVTRQAELSDLAAGRNLAMQIQMPTDHDDPPTLMHNRRGFDAGEALVTFYMTPSYWTWDPSPVVLLSFAVFFAMILADAGYAALMGVLLVLLWGKLARSAGGRRMRALLSLLTGASVAYGIIVGSYFGVAPAEDSWLGRAALLNVNDADSMMALSIILGVVHLAFANVMNARRFGWRAQAIAPMGWAAMIAGGFLIPVGGAMTLPLIRTLGLVLLVVGALMVLLFSGAGQKPLARALSGLLAFTKVTAAFGDVLSYLRLFALGLASASLAVAFNDMASQLRDAVPGLGLLLMVLVLLLGHTLNLILSLSSAVIHGLRLNVIEFFNWGVPEEGRPFTAFAKKEP